ncbi:MAG: nucleotide exchange factor GrpE [Candidatus Vidania fulgoroideorum]
MNNSLSNLIKNHIILSNKYKELSNEIVKIKSRYKKSIFIIKKFSDEKLIINLIPIIDCLEVLFSNCLCNDTKNGINVTINLIKSIFKNNNVTKIKPRKLDKFNPKYHEAILSVKTIYCSNLIFNVLRNGYIMFNKTLRPALVSITS